MFHFTDNLQVKILLFTFTAPSEMTQGNDDYGKSIKSWLMWRCTGCVCISVTFHNNPVVGGFITWCSVSFRYGHDGCGLIKQIMLLRWN